MRHKGGHITRIRGPAAQPSTRQVLPALGALRGPLAATIGACCGSVILAFSKTRRIAVFRKCRASLDRLTYIVVLLGAFLGSQTRHVSKRWYDIGEDVDWCTFSLYKHTVIRGVVCVVRQK
jgi:hypothetical protein